MNAIDYIKKLRRIAAIAWLGSLLFLLALAWLHVIPLNEFLPFVAIGIGSIPILAFMRKNRVRCEACGGQMKISSGYPRIVYRCTQCQAELDTGIYSD